MPVGQLRQTLEARVAEHLPLAAQHLARGRTGHLAQLLIHLGQQPDIQPRVAAQKRHRRCPTAPILHPSGPPMLPDQTRQLRP